MDAPAIPACQDPRRRATGEVLTWGEREDGSMAHIADVVRGLKCACTCSGCGARLSAAKGPIKQHHFRHHNALPCRQSFESALHKLAKELLDERREMLLPEIRVRKGKRDLVTHTQRVHTFDDALLEHHLDGIVPDVIVRKGDNRLLVEMVVTHRCGPEKVQRIRSLGMACVEVDLSKLPRDASRDRVAESLLSEAHRYWVHNPKIEEAAEALARAIADEEEAARIAAEKAAAERSRKIGELAAMADRHKSNPLVPPNRETSAIRAVRAAGHEPLIGKVVEGDFSLALAPAQWQSLIVRQFVLDRLAGQRGLPPAFSSAEVFDYLRARGLLRPGVPAFVDPDTERDVRTLVPRFTAPYRIIEAYLGWLAKEGLLDRSRAGWSISSETRAEWRETIKRREELAQLEQELKALVGRVLNALPGHERGSFSTKRWWSEELAEFVSSPAALLDADDHRLPALRRGLERIEAMVTGQAEPAATILGLPVAAANERAKFAKAEQLEQEKIEAELNAEAERRKRVAHLTSAARSELAEDAASWLSTPQKALGDRSPAQVARVSQHDLVEVEGMLWDARLERQRRLRTLQYRNRILEAARHLAKPDHARAFLLSSNPQWNNKHPIDACVDEASFERLRSAMIKAAR